MIDTVDTLLTTLTVVSQILIVLIGISLIIYRSARERNFLLNFLKKHALVLAFSVALVATLGSLFYSEIAGYTPCRLCWFQRIFMYPQVILLGFAMLRRESFVFFYAGMLSAIGAVIAAYHYLLQIGVTTSVSCGAVGYAAGCSGQFVMDLGYITIPMMAFTAFVMIIIMSLLKKGGQVS